MRSERGRLSRHADVAKAIDAAIAAQEKDPDKNDPNDEKVLKLLQEAKAAQAAQPWLTPPQEALAWRRVASTPTPPEPEFQPRALWTPPLTPQPVVDSLAWLQRRWRIEEAILEVVAGQFPMGTLPTPAIVIAGPYWIARQQVVVGGPVRGQGLWT